MSPISHDGNSSSSATERNAHTTTPSGNGTTINGGYTNGNGVNRNEADISAQEPMAIIGMACQFPQDADNPERFWKLLVEGKSAMTEFPPEKLNIDSHYHPDPAHGSSMSNRGGHFLKSNGATFDAQFFTLTKSEALSMDPQQRILMENVYLALENAGISMELATSSKTSVFVGAFTNDYQKSIIGKDPDVTLKYMPTGTSNSILANRVSWFYNFKGTSLTLDTACSSSLVAFHLAAQDLCNGHAEMAVVSGVNVIEDPELFYRMSSLGFLSPDSKCYSFDHRANGYSRGEGVGTVIIKPLRAALRDGNTIRAIVRGTGVNSDGRTPGITMPSKDAQVDLIKDVYVKAGLEPRYTGFVEAHGTGTPAGDPVEAGAIAMGFSGRESTTPLFIGALKSNVGHMEGASGVAGLIKSVMILEKGVIPPNINFEKVNPRIPEKEWNIAFPLAPMQWPQPGPRRISVNSFGFGGTNAHAILDDAYHYLRERGIYGHHRTVSDQPGVQNRQTKSSDEVPIPRLFVWSTSDETGIRRLLDAFSEFMSSERNVPMVEDEYLDDLAYTLATKRTLFPYRSYVQATTLSELVNSIEADAGPLKPLRSKASTNLGFVFTGQGAQWARMGVELLQYPVFKNSFDDADAYLKTLGSPWSLIDEIYKHSPDSRINYPAVSQTMCTVLQIALVDLLRTWNITPARVVGHSSGEIAAAYTAGAISRESAWRIAYYRGVVSSHKTENKGAMMAVAVGEDAVRPYVEKINSSLDGELIIACFNSPKSLTISGDEPKIDALKALLDADDIFARKLRVMNAYHSAHMLPVAEEYLHLIGDITPTLNGTSKSERAPKLPLMYSSVSGKLIAVHELRTAQYWVDNMINQVRFSQAVVEMCLPETGRGRRRIGKGGDAPIQMLLEVGPHLALQSACSDSLSAAQIPTPYTYLLKRNTNAVVSTLDTMGRLFCLGCPVDLHSLNHTSRSINDKGRTAGMLTNLPGYVFNHSQTYWPESRLSKNFRFRKHPRHDLLGVPVPDWNPAEPKWRHLIRLSENPWLRDHEITGAVVYPGVGYIIMAIEASRQLSNSKSEILGFRLRDISIKAALQVPDVEDGVEVVLSMRAATESGLRASAIWREFSISSYSPDGETWTEHCRGKISVDLATEIGPIDNGLETAYQEQIFADLLQQSSARCTDVVDMTNLYSELETIGLNFGPLFKNLSQARYAGSNQGEAVATVTIPDVAATMAQNYLESHIIHPATMDSMLHMFLAAFHDLIGGAKIVEPLLPVFLQEVWVSKGTSNRPGNTFTAHGSVRRISQKKLEASITVWDSEGSGRVSVRGMQAIPLQDTASGSAADRNLCFNIKWKPDVDLLETTKGHAYFEKALERNPANENEILRMTKELQLATIIYIRDAIKGIETNPPEAGLLWYHEKYMELLRHWWSQYENGLILHQSPDWQTIMDDPSATAAFLDRVALETLDGKLLARLGPKMVPVLRQEADAIELMFGDDILEVYYRETIGTARIQSQLTSYLETAGHKWTNSKVLEIGAGTGGTSTSVLSSLCPVGDDGVESKTSSLGSYTYTDISAGFFEAAKEKFKSWRSLMNFRTLNIEKDPLEQGFEERDYDIIVAANVLHATADLNATLENVRKLLRPGGKLILVEGTQPEMLRGPMCFGLLPGWWLSIEPERRLGPLLSKQGWHDILQKHDFNGTELFLQDNKDPGIHFQSLIISSASQANADPEVYNQEILIVVSPSNRSSDIGACVQNHLQGKGLGRVSTVQYTELDQLDLREVICVVLPELFSSILNSMDNTTMSSIRHMLTTAAGVLWVTRDLTANPEVAMVNGIIRTLRWERDLDGSNLVTLSFEDDELPETKITDIITKIFDFQFLKQHDQRHAEYVYASGLVNINRLYYSQRVNNFLRLKSTKPSPQNRPFGADSSRALSLTVRTPGLLDTLEFIDDATHNSPLGDREIEVRIHATGLNFRDVMVAMNEIDDIALGLEAAGVVTKVGGDNSQDLRVGDRVMMLSNITGCFQTYARTTQDLIVKIPDQMPFEVAAAIPVTFSTAYYCLVDVARLNRGDSILIHSAAGGVGQAAIMLSKHLGAVIYVTVSSEEKRSLMMDTYGIPAEHIFSSRGLSFAQGIMRVTQNRGVDVVLNSLSGEALRRSWDCIAPFGRFIEIGKKDVYANGKLDMYAFSKSATFAAVDLNLVIHLDAKTGGRLLKESLNLWEKKIVRTTSPFNVFKYSQLEDAFRMMQAGKHIGKVVLKADAGDVVRVVPSLEDPFMFSPDASYLLPGGLGGIGRSTSRWMVSRGARSLIFINRSATWTENTKVAVNELLIELKQKGCTATVFECDISNMEMLSKVMEQCKATLPPIKGCIHGAMQLKDSAFENMTLENFNAAIRPKVQGSWNLHQLLPKDLDFFIMLSSVAGVLGNRGQSNYAAGNNYQDALALHRHSLGMPSYSLDLGNILSVGFIAENKDLFQGNMSAITQEGVRADELLSVFEYHVDPRHWSPDLVDSQVCIGLVTADTFKRKGMPLPSFLSTPLFTHLCSETSANGSAGNSDSGGVGVQTLLSSATSLEQASSIVIEAISKRLSTTLAIQAEDIDPGKPIHFYGVDSLVAMEFRSWFAKSMACDIPVLDIMGNSSIAVLGKRIAGLSKYTSVEAKVDGVETKEA